MTPAQPHQAMSQTDSLIADRDLAVEMRDGTRLAIDVFRPNADRRFPALLGMSPYSKDIQSLGIRPQSPAAPLYHPSLEAGDPAFFVSRGYVHAIVDCRGMGKSEGSYRGWMSRQEAEDGADLVEWIAAQPWCDGNVGMVGISYFGTIQLAVAAQQPPHLKAIMPFNAPADFYRECTHHGGILQVFFHLLYGISIRGRSVTVTAEELSPEELQGRVDEIAADPDIRMYADLYRTLVNADRTPSFRDVLLNPLDGPFYRERSATTTNHKIRIPTYLFSAWWAYAHMHLRGAFQNFAEVQGPKRVVIGPPVVPDCPLSRAYHEEAIRWYDHWLKGHDTGVLDDLPVRVFVMGSNRWRNEEQWPLERTRWTKFYLHPTGGLVQEVESPQSEPDVFVQQAPVHTDAIASLRYRTARLAESIEVTGPIALYLHAAIDQTDTNWIVSLKDVTDDGAEHELTRGFLKASHRRLDPERSQPWLPYHPHTEVDPVTPGDVYEYAIELSPTANVFRRGHRIQLEITSMDHPTTPAPIISGVFAPVRLGAWHLPHHVCSSRTTVHSVHHDPEHASHLLLPVIPADDREVRCGTEPVGAAD